MDQSYGLGNVGPVAGCAPGSRPSSPLAWVKRGYQGRRGSHCWGSSGSFQSPSGCAIRGTPGSIAAPCDLGYGPDEPGPVSQRAKGSPVVVVSSRAGCAGAQERIVDADLAGERGSHGAVPCCRSHGGRGPKQRARTSLSPAPVRGPRSSHLGAVASLGLPRVQGAGRPDRGPRRPGWARPRPPVPVPGLAGS